MLSLPVRERGLKVLRFLRVAHAVVSLPVRERGLKVAIYHHILISLPVAPCAGAWVERGPFADYPK